MEKHDLAGKRIIVAGAGLAGLAFVCGLHQSWPTEHPRPDVIVYERSAKDLDRKRQGYTMGIKPETGLTALKQLGLLDIALSNSTVGVNGMEVRPTIWRKDWRPMLDLNAGAKLEYNAEAIPVDGIRMVRYKLRDVLLDAVSGTAEIRWGNGCESARRLKDGRIQVTLGDGMVEDCDLLVVADGANSSIRSALLPDEHLEYTGAVCWIGTSIYPSGKPDLLQNKWGINVSGEGFAFLNFPVDDTAGVWSLTQKTDQPRERIKGDEAVQRYREILDEVHTKGHMYSEPFGQIVEATDPETLQVFSAMHKSPILHADKIPNTNVVFIGDANHPMSPFSGNGANMALLDAVVLAHQLAGSRSVRTAIDNFDADSAPRSQKAIDGSRLTIRLLHVKGIEYLMFSMFLLVLNFFLRLKRSFL